LSDAVTEVVTRKTSPVNDVITRQAAKGDRKTAATRAPGSIDVYREDFSAQKAGPAWLNKLRAKGLERFEALGFPTTRNEDWHFTSVAAIAERTFRIAGLETDSTTPSSADRRESSRRKVDAINALGVKPADLESLSFGQGDWHRLVFVNGSFDRALSSAIDGLGARIRVSSLSQAIEEGVDSVERHLGRIAVFDQHAFTALNTAFVNEGVFIELANDAVLEKPIHLVFISGGEGVSHPRNLIVAGRHSRATVIETYVSLRDSAYFTNAVTEIAVGEGAHVDHYKLQRESRSAFHVGTVQARQESNGTLHSFSFAVGGVLARTNVYTSLDGDAATCTLNGLYLTDGTQHIDNQTSIEHVAPNCPSHEVYKGVLDGRSHGVFNGKVYVHPEAQKTDGKQSNNNLLLSPHARVDTKPQLEIFADDVKCTHGATVGRLDDVAMFYLSSRGIGAETARMLLTYAFAADVLETIELEPLKAELEKIVLARFAGSPVE